MGDLNDGSSRDVVDDIYLLHSIVHELRGAFHRETALMRHVLSSKQLQTKSYAWTVEFRDATNQGEKPAFSWITWFTVRSAMKGGLCYVPDSGQIEHAAYGKHIVKSGKTRTSARVTTGR